MGSASEFPGIRFAKSRRPLPPGNLPVKGDIVEFAAGSNAAKHQPPAAHVSPADERFRVPETVAQSRTERRHVFFGGNAPEKDKQGIRAGGVQCLEIPHQRQPVNIITAVEIGCGKPAQLLPVNVSFRRDQACAGRDDVNAGLPLRRRAKVLA